MKTVVRVYALREGGAPIYIGITGGTLTKRLKEHKPGPSVTIDELVTCAGYEEAAAIEAEVIRALSEGGVPLTNRVHVPKARRQPARVRHQTRPMVVLSCTQEEKNKLEFARRKIEHSMPKGVRLSMNGFVLAAALDKANQAMAGAGAPGAEAVLEKARRELGEK